MGKTYFTNKPENEIDIEDLKKALSGVMLLEDWCRCWGGYHRQPKLKQLIINTYEVVNILQEQFYIEEERRQANSKQMQTMLSDLLVMSIMTCVRQGHDVYETLIMGIEKLMNVEFKKNFDKKPKRRVTIEIGRAINGICPRCTNNLEGEGLERYCKKCEIKFTLEPEDLK